MKDSDLLYLALAAAGVLGFFYFYKKAGEEAGPGLAEILSGGVPK